jgi:hypothetical protein
LNDTDTQFIKWAVYSILHWENSIVPENHVHIHGTSDRLLPYRLVKADYPVKKWNTSNGNEPAFGNLPALKTNHH